MKKVLRAIGGFFAKIGRWIANTAWVQPLLIVGGIFAVIFSIPYIKSGIEGLQNSNTTDSNVTFYTSKAISLDGIEEGNSKADRLFKGLENNDAEAIKSEFGEKFFVTFARKTCDACKSCVDGWKYFSSNWRTLESESNYKLYTIMVDTKITDKNSERYDTYAAKLLFENYEGFFSDVTAEFVDNKEDYVFWKNLSTLDKSSAANSLVSSIEKLPDAADDVSGDGLDVPTTFLIDFSNNPDKEIISHGVTEIFFNYTDNVTNNPLYTTTNKVTKGYFLRDAWNYKELFSKTYKAK